MTATGGSARSTTAPTAAERIPAGPAAPVPPRSAQRPAPPARFRFPALDGLRGPAVLLVIGFSLRGTLAHLFTPAALRYPFDGGFAGIDVLLVLAGFLICQRLLEPDGLGLSLSGRLFRRFLPLHLAAWAIALCWVAPTVLSATSTAKGTPWNWLCTAALLSGFVSAGPAGYSLAWALSVGLWIAAALITLTVIAGASDVLLDRIGPLGRASQFGRPTRLGPGHLVRPALFVGVIAAAGGVLLLLTGVQFGDSATISATYQNGGPAVGRALLGLGTGMLTFLLLRVSTGPLGPPTQQLLLRRRFPPGIGAGLALVGLGLCVYRFDLVTELHLIPVFPVAAALVYFAAQDDEGRVHRALAGRPAQWLGSRAAALFVLHPAVLICVLQVNTRLHANLDSPWISGFVVVEFAVGALAGAELGHRYLDRLLTNRPARVAHSGLLNVAPRIQSGLAANPVPRPKTTGAPAKVTAGAKSGSPGKSTASPTTATEAEKAKEKESARRTARTAAKATTTKPKPKPIDQAVVSPQLRLRSTRAKKATDPVAAPAQPTAARTAARTASPPTRTAAAAARNSAAKKAPAAKKAAPTTKSVTARKLPAAPTAATAKKKGGTADQSIDVRKSTVDLRKTTVDLTPDAAPTPANPPAGPRGTGPKAKPAAPKEDETP